MSNFDTQETKLRAVLEDLKRLLIPPSRLTVLDSFQVGSGGYGEVVLAKLDESDQVAVKQLRTAGTNGARIRVALRLARELKIWAKVHHPNILRLIGYYLSEDYEIAQLVSPFMVNGNVLRYIAEFQPEMRKRLDFVQDITVGMAYLHSHDPPICHGDLKPENVLINDYATAMLCDLGLASIVDEAQAPSGLTTSQSLKGSTRYMCPELLMEIETKHTLAGDVWAWGCTAFQILTNVEPYANAKAEFGVIAAILQHESPGDLLMLSTGNFGEPMNELRVPLSDHLRGCWSPEPAKRPSMADSVRLIGLRRREELSSIDSERGDFRVWWDSISDACDERNLTYGPSTCFRFRDFYDASPTARVKDWHVTVFICRDALTNEDPTGFVTVVNPGQKCDIALGLINANEYLILKVESVIATGWWGTLKTHVGKAIIPTSVFAHHPELRHGRQSFHFAVVDDGKEEAKLVCEVDFIPR